MAIPILVVDSAFACKAGDRSQLDHAAKNGFGSLEALPFEKRDSLMIANLHTLAQVSVMQLGAIAFIHKPANGDKIDKVLHAYGLEPGVAQC